MLSSSILSSTLPIQYMKSTTHDDISVVDKIVQMCSALNNLCVFAIPLCNITDHE